MRILITGSRTWSDTETIAAALTEVIHEHSLSREDTLIIHGACPSGADNMAHNIATAWGVTVEAHPADWKTHGRAAGFKRNQYMVDLGADILLAFIKDYSAGASHTLRQAEAAGIPVRVFRA